MTKQFVADVISGRMVNIPEKFANHHDIEQGDSIELRVVSHKRDDETIFQEEDNQQ